MVTCSSYGRLVCKHSLTNRETVRFLVDLKQRTSGVRVQVVHFIEKIQLLLWSFSGLCRTPDSFTITQWLVRERLQLGISQQQQKKLQRTALTKAITRLSVQDVVLQLHHPSPTLFLWERRFPGSLTRRWYHVTGYDTKLGTLHYFFTRFFSLSVKIQAHPVFWVSRSAVSF